MKIKALCGITAPDPQGVSYSYSPEDVGNCHNDHANYLISEGFAEKAAKDAEITAKPTKKPVAMPRGTAKAGRVEKAKAVKARIPPAPKTTKPVLTGPTDASLKRREQDPRGARAALLGEE